MLRATEFARLDATNVAYLDYAGGGLYAESQIAAHRARLEHSVLGNPHSANDASLASTHAIDGARERVLRFFDAGDDYVVCFTANATAAIKLVAESYPFGPSAPFVLSADNHNSVNGVREYARRAGAHIEYLPLTSALRLDDPERRLANAASKDPAGGGKALFAFPAQSNFSGVQHPLSLVRTAQSLGYRVLLDAAAYVPSHALSLRACPADFVAISFYKMFGYPTGVGALLARKDALETLARPWFSGGTVEYVSVQLDRHQLRPLHAAFEDGTPNYLDLAAIEDGLAFIEGVGLDRISAHTTALARALIDGLSRLRHESGAPLVRMYGIGGERGATIAFNVLDVNGRALPFDIVEQRANDVGVQLRSGCFCNPGAAEAAFGLDASRLAEARVGAVRASLGLANNQRDVERCIDAVASFATSTRQETARQRQRA